MRPTTHDQRKPVVWNSDDSPGTPPFSKLFGVGCCVIAQPTLPCPRRLVGSCAHMACARLMLPIRYTPSSQKPLTILLQPPPDSAIAPGLAAPFGSHRGDHQGHTMCLCLKVKHCCAAAVGGPPYPAAACPRLDAAGYCSCW